LYARSHSTNGEDVDVAPHPRREAAREPEERGVGILGRALAPDVGIDPESVRPVGLDGDGEEPLSLDEQAREARSLIIELRGPVRGFAEEDHAGVPDELEECLVRLGARQRMQEGLDGCHEGAQVLPTLFSSLRAIWR
jgi:hypothetical protein